MHIKLTTGDFVPAINMAQLTQKLFNGKVPYRTLYFSPKSLQKYIPGGFYLWLDKFTETTHTHNLGNGLAWEITIEENKTKIKRRFVGDRKCLTDEIMDKHGKKILVFDKRNDFSGVDFLGVFMEEDMLLYNNEFIGMTYSKVKDTIEYELPEVIEKKKKVSKTTLEDLESRKDFLERVLQGLDDKESDAYKLIKNNIDEINEEIKKFTK